MESGVTSLEHEPRLLSGTEAMQFTESDYGWLQSMSGRQFNQDDLQTLGALYDDAIQNARKSVTLKRRDEILASREALASFMGLNDINNPFYDTFQRIRITAPPSENPGFRHGEVPPMPSGALRMLSNSRTLFNEGLDFKKMYGKYPQLAVMRGDYLKNLIQFLRDNDLLVGKILTKIPNIASQKIETTRDKIAALVDLGLDAQHVINTNPVALGYSSDSVLDKMASLECIGVDAAQVINKTPKLLDARPEALTAKARLIGRYLEVLHIDVPTGPIIEERPGLLIYSTKHLGFIARAYAEYGVNHTGHPVSAADVASAIHRSPESMITDIASDGTVGIARGSGLRGVGQPYIRQTALDIAMDTDSPVSERTRRSYLRARPMKASEASKYGSTTKHS